MHQAIAQLRRIGGPVLRAATQQRFSVGEAVSVGPQALLGEVVGIDADDILVQVYEDTTGLRHGAPVVGSGAPLSVSLGPGLLGQVFDGLLRPLPGAARHVEPGAAPVRRGAFDFTPVVGVGDLLAPGAAFGQVGAPGRLTQSCLVPPDLAGSVRRIASPGRYDETAPICELQDAAGTVHPLAMSHPWPVRVPRPVRARLPADEPLLTGQRILDSLFPVARGGKAAIPGGFGTGKTVLLETLAKWCDADVIVYLGCGERGNEMAGVLDEFPQLDDPRTGRRLMERTVIIANTSNMPVAAREAGIYSAMTVAEYFRDQGLHVALMADSTSRWAEALREVSGRLGELPGEGGYPAYLASRLAEFYERAAKVETLGGRVGSVTVLGSISPPSGDFSEPVTSHTKRYVRSLWALDARRAQARFYPAIDPLQSYAQDAPRFSDWWRAHGNPDWEPLRHRFLSLLAAQAKLERMARIIGKDALPPPQQLTLLCAELIGDAFLRQSAYSPVDRYASPHRQGAMMRLLGRFVALAEQAVAAGVAPDTLRAMPVYRTLLRMGEDVPEETAAARLAEMGDALEAAFASLREAHASATLR